MRADELAEELAEFWFSAVADAGWDARLEILREVDAQLRADLEQKSEYDVVFPRFVAAIIERLGAPPVSENAQATIYDCSADERHRAAARLWSVGAVSEGAPSPDRSAEERRRFRRQRVNFISEIWMQGRAAPCRVIDLSTGGARVLAQGIDPEPGTQVHLAVPESGVREARVVFRNDLGIGLQFAEHPAAA